MGPGGYRKQIVHLSKSELKNFNRKLIAAVRSHPCLYDKYYTGKEKEYAIWKQLSIEFNEPAQALQKRFRNIRIGFVKELRSKLRFERAKKAGIETCRFKPYYLSAELQFLAPYCTQNKSKLLDMSSDFTDSDDEDPSLDDSGTTQSHQDFDVPRIESVFVLEEDANEDVKDPNLKLMNAFEMECDPAESTDKPEVSLVTPKTEPAESAEPEASLTTPAAIEPAESPSGQMSSQHPAHDYERTPEWNFFHSIMPDIMNMTAAQKRQMRMRFIGVIDDIMDKEEE